MTTKVVIKCSDMPESIKNYEYLGMQLEAISQAIQAYYNVTEIDEENPADSYRSIAMDIKKEFDKKYKPCWHCIVGIKYSLNFIL